MTTYFLVQPGQCRCHDDDDGQGAASAAELLQVTLSAASNGATVKMSGAVSFNNAAADAAASCDESAAVSGFF